MPTSQGVQERAYAEALKTAQTRPEDGATIALGRRLAQLIDVLRGEEAEPPAVVKLAAEYRQVLTALGMTPAARAARDGRAVQPTGGPARSPLDELRLRRAAKEDAS